MGLLKWHFFKWVTKKNGLKNTASDYLKSMQWEPNFPGNFTANVLVLSMQLCVFTGHQPFKQGSVHLGKGEKFWMIQVATQIKGNSGKNQASMNLRGSSPASFTFLYAGFRHLVLNHQASILDCYDHLLTGCPVPTLSILDLFFI